MPLFTLGYEGLSFQSYFEILEDNRVQILVDVRQNPLSRKPGFSKTALGAHCERQNIRYLHLQSLGCPLPIRNNYRENGEWEVYTRDYLAHLETQSAFLKDLAALVETQNCCLMCFEADANFCHRSFVAQALERLGRERAIHLTRNVAPIEALALV